MTSPFITKAAVLAAALAAAAGIGFMAPAAQAAPQHHAVAAHHAVATHHADQAPAGWIDRGKYWTFDGCNSDGQQGVQRGAWDQYQCANGTVFWNLWTNR
ncbi:hypothetical protein [Streptantibioticus ferralitis]|uniref:Uncharacterized protein n=1 Tax=Streptantibioticus ferralitis TaxID=236510 RepID=A0ABT5Z255_9ACTN|nr:hypothetical protein [Streptantibioticus ferralitis]MDF2257900.1 hypothetical protein [Streptantibioticus ferralitis]